jgi:hypothetical protein
MCYGFFVTCNPVNITADLFNSHSRIYLVEDSTGSGTITTWGSAYKFAGGTKPTLTTTAAAIDYIDCFVRDASDLDCIFTGNTK